MAPVGPLHVFMAETGSSSSRNATWRPHHRALIIATNSARGATLWGTLALMELSCLLPFPFHDARLIALPSF